MNKKFAAKSEVTPLFKLSGQETASGPWTTRLRSVSDKSYKSRHSSTYSSVSRLVETRIKLELARLTKSQNEERLREERAEAEVKAIIERQKAEIERDLQRRKIVSAKNVELKPLN